MRKEVSLDAVNRATGRLVSVLLAEDRVKPGGLLVVGGEHQRGSGGADRHCYQYGGGGGYIYRYDGGMSFSFCFSGSAGL